jgi:hypothetical protein
MRRDVRDIESVWHPSGSLSHVTEVYPLLQIRLLNTTSVVSINNSDIPIARLHVDCQEHHFDTILQELLLLHCSSDPVNGLEHVGGVIPSLQRR